DLLSFHAKAQRMVHLWRREQAEEVAEKEPNDSDVEEVAAPKIETVPEEAAGLTPPCELASVESRPGPEEIGDHAEIGIEPEEELVEPVHDPVPFSLPPACSGFEPAISRSIRCTIADAIWQSAAVCSSRGVSNRTGG